MKILFISPKASRSGAPFVLLYFIKWLNRNTSHKVDVLLLEDGPLAAEFKKECGHVFTKELFYTKPDILVRRTLRKISNIFPKVNDAEIFKKKIPFEQYQLVYGNTIASLKWLLQFKKAHHIKSAIALHELSFALETFYKPSQLKDDLEKLDRVIAGSEAVRSNLVRKYGLKEDFIRVAHAFVIHDHLPQKRNLSLLRSLGISNETFIIGGAGKPEWRKGTDLIIPLIKELKSSFPHINFHVIWIGGRYLDTFERSLMIDVQKLGLMDYFTLIENTPEYLEYINLFDVFLMLSREDPFPLVSLEAGLLQKPIIMFEGTGGTAELVRDDAGIQIPYLDVIQLARDIARLNESEPLRERFGLTLNQRVEEHFGAEKTCRKLEAIIGEQI